MMSRWVGILVLGLLAGCASALYVSDEEIRALEQGMTEKQVVEKIGNPREINRTETARGERAQFVYRQPPNDWAYLYFEDHTLVSMQY